MLTTSTTTKNDNWIEALGIKRAKIPVLLIGNNPIEMTSFFNVLVGIQSKNYLIEVCFDVKDGFHKIAKERPEVIFIDDNLPLDDVKKMVRILRQNAKTKNIKIIVLKSTNWSYNVIDNVDDYVLKDTIKADLMEKVIDKNLNPIEHQFA